MKASYLVGVFAVLLLAGAGCTGSGATNNTSGENTNTNGGAMMEQDGVYGTWVVTEAEGSYASDNVGTTYVINKSSNTFTTKKGIIENTGSIESMTDSRIEVMFEGFEAPFFYTYSVDGDTLTIEIENSGGQVLTLERK